MSCIEAVNVEELSEEEADKKYKVAAEIALTDLEVHDILEDK